MRLLRRSPNGAFELVSFTDDDAVPPYAILSHTWIHGEEVLHNELVAGTRTGKAGYRKLDFCATRAGVDGLEYFWIDTCCIDKSTSDELSTAINSMFHWYQRAAACYVYLSDVSVPDEVTDAKAQRDTWVDAFRRSRWFTRGWTLQELLAPVSVEFFSQDGRLLGNKTSLEKDIREITEIPREVLRGRELAMVSIEERMSWAANRTTTLKEDKVYCLLGIFGVFLPLIYGEGEAYATQRLQDEIERRRSARGPAHLPAGEEQLGSLLLPFPRNELFVGRETELQSLSQRLLISNAHRRMTIYGLGGCGKSALALEFAYRLLAATAGHLVFWVPALSQGSFELAYRDIGLRLRVPGIIDDDANIKQLVKDALSVDTGREWLMIVDNVDDPGVLMKGTGSDVGELRLHDYLPHSARGRILFTTRSRKIAGDLSPGNILDLHDMSREDARQLLAGRVSNQISLAKENTNELLGLLAYLPLAIVQAAAFIDSNQVSVAEYISLLREKDTAAELFSQHFEDISRYGQVESTIAKTWHISFDHLRKQDPLAAEYLSFMACIDRISIPQSLLPRGTSIVQQMRAIGTLKGYAFITERQPTLPEPGERIFDIHRLVHLASIWWLEVRDEQKTWTAKAAERLEDLIPYGDVETKQLWTKHLPHAVHISRQEGGLDDLTRASLLARVGRCQLTLGQYSTAIATNRQGLNLRESALGKEHPLTLTSMSNLAEVLAGQGKYDEAEEMNRSILETRDKLLGAHHLDTLTTKVKLAVVLMYKGQHDETEALLRETLAAQTILLGPGHSNTLTTMNNLALILNEKNNYQEAEEMYRAILTQEKLQRPDHPDTLKSISNLAVVLGNQGKHEAAEEMYRDALAGHMRQMGPDHPDTLLSVYSFAHWLGMQHRFAEAAVLYERASTGFSKVLGDDHPITRKCKNHYSDVRPLSLQQDAPPIDGFLESRQRH